MGDGERSAARNLALEERYDAAAAAKHIAESHGDELRARCLGETEHDHLRDALCRAHDVRWPHGLIRGNQDELLRADRIRCACDIERSAHVVFHGLVRVQLHERDVLVRGGMKKYCGTMRLDDSPHLALVT